MRDIQSSVRLVCSLCHERCPRLVSGSVAVAAGHCRADGASRPAGCMLTGDSPRLRSVESDSPALMRRQLSVMLVLRL